MKNRSVGMGILSLALVIVISGTVLSLMMHKTTAGLLLIGLAAMLYILGKKHM